MSRDELAVMNGSKCILQLRGVRPFLSDKYDLTQHPNFKYTAEMLIIFGCIIYAIVQKMWPSMFILITMEVCIIIVSLGVGVLDRILQIAQENLRTFMKS